MGQTVNKWLTRLLVIGMVFGIYFFVPDAKREVNEAAAILARADIKGMREFLKDFGIWGPAVSMFLMILQAIAAPLPAFVITFANSWIWGWAFGAFISWTGAMIAAVICFYLARWFGRPLVEKLVGVRALAISDGFFERYGKYTVLIARLVPLVSFDLISYAAGLINMSLWQFLWATGLGQLPATLVYSYLGENITSGYKYGLLVFTGVISLLILSFLLKKRMEERILKEGEAYEPQTPPRAR